MDLCWYKSYLFNQISHVINKVKTVLSKLRIVSKFICQKPSQLFNDMKEKWFRTALEAFSPWLDNALFPLFFIYHFVRFGQKYCEDYLCDDASFKEALAKGINESHFWELVPYHNKGIPIWRMLLYKIQ